MNATEARQALLVRAFETPITPPWSESDAAWASAEAARVEGEAAPAERLIVRRAALACERLAARDAGIAIALARPGGLAGVAAACVAGAFAIGITLDVIGPAQRLNIVALPLLGLLAWHIVVYALLLLAPVLRQGSRAPRTGWRTSLALWSARRRASSAPLPALARYFSDAGAASTQLDASRIAFVMHIASAAFAAGLLASMYARGFAFEYRAGWESTFLSAQGVHRLLSVLLAPALWLTGQALPAPDQIAALRFSVGPGENAARWIHWLALSVTVVVLLPRAVLASNALLRARALARNFPIDLRTPYFQRLLPDTGHAACVVRVLPYSYRLAPDLIPGLRTVLREALGTRVDVQVAQSLPVGSEDDLPRHLPPVTEGQEHACYLPLFSMTATPERETHGAFLRALSAIGGPRACDALGVTSAFDVLIDESAFRRTFDAARLSQRRAAWEKLLEDVGQRALFVDLEATVR